MSEWLLALATASILPPVRVIKERPPLKPAPRIVRVLQTRPTQNRLGDLLQSVNFYEKSYGPSGSLTTASLRGSSAEGVLVELDGIRLNSPLNGMADLGKLPLLGLERIEVENGAGTDGAVGGAIRLRTNDNLSSLLSLGFGSFGQASLRAQIGEEGISFALARDTAKNDYPYSDRGTRKQRENAGITTTSVFAKGKKEWNDWTLRPMVLFDLRDQSVPGAINFPTPQAHQEDLSLLASLALENRGEDTAKKVSVTSRIERNHFEDPRAVLTPKQSSLFLDSTEARWETRWDRGEHAPILALGVKQDRTEGGIRRSQETYSLRVEDGWWHDWGLLEGTLGFDRFSTFGNAFSPKLGFSRTDGPHRTHLSLGSAFRAPTFNELYWPEDAFAKGNPSIKPERVYSLDLGWDGKWGNFQTGLTLFGSLGQDQISWQPAGTKWMPLNLAQTIGRGAEFEAAYRLPERSLSGHYSYCAITAEGKQLVGRPLEQLRLEGTQKLWDGTFGADLAYASQSPTTAANTEFLPAYWLMGLSAEWKLGERTIGLRVQNLLDVSYSVVPYYPMPGRIVSLNFVQPL